MISLGLNRLLNPNINFIILDEVDATLSSDYREVFNRILELSDFQIIMISHSGLTDNINLNKQIIKLDKQKHTVG